MLRFGRKRTKPSVITLADRARDQGQWERAAAYYQVALRRNSQNPPIWVQYGHVLKESGEIDQAERAYRIALAHDPRNADTYVQLGHVLKIQGKKDEAPAVYLKAIAIDPSLNGLSVEFGPLGWSEAHFSQLRDMLGARADEPTTPSSDFRASPGHHTNGDGSDTFPMRRRRSPFRFSPRRRRPSRITLADQARDAGKWGLAAEYYSAALNRNPRNAPIWVQYGHVLKEAGNLSQAERAYRNAIDIDPSDSDSNLQLGHLLKIQGRKEEARTAYLRAIAVNPSLTAEALEFSLLGWSETYVSALKPMLQPLGHSLPGRSAAESSTAAAGQVASPENQSEGSGDYAEWVRLYDTIEDDDRRAIATAIENMSDRPLISVVMPVYNTPEEYLRAAINSVRQQLYPNWELCIADDASTVSHVRTVLEHQRAIDPRIKVCYRKENGHISAASNSALALATGSFIALLDHDDVLPKHALYMVAVTLNSDPRVDLIYSDEDKIDASGQRFSPNFKSGWNPDLILSQNVFCHLGVYRRSIIEKIGGFRLGYEGSQDYDLVLRAQTLTSPDRIRHIPYILYHWRAIPGSAAFGFDEKDYAVDSARRAITHHLIEVGISADVVASPHAAWHRIRYSLPSPPPRVTIIISAGKRGDLPISYVEDLLRRTDYPDLEVLIVNDHSRTEETQTGLDHVSVDRRIRIVSYQEPLHHLSAMSFAAERATGSVLCLLDEAVAANACDWLSEMVSHALRPGVGAVGALLYSPDDRIYHAGIVVDPQQIAYYPHRGLRRGDMGYFGRAVVTQNLSAVLAACLVMPKAVFMEIGGFNERNLPVGLNDVDLCLRIRAAGYRIVWTPHAELYYHTSMPLFSDPEWGERADPLVGYMRKIWGDVLNRDPYYNPNLSIEEATFGLAFPPRVERPWGGKGDCQNSPTAQTSASGNGLNPIEFSKLAEELISARPQAQVPDLFELRTLKPKGRVAVVLHLYYPDLWDEMRLAIERIRAPFDLFVSLVKSSSAHMRTTIARDFPNAYVFDFENRGRDIGPFLAFVETGVLFRYDLVCKLHAKRSPRRTDGNAWRGALIEGILGSARQIDEILLRFEDDADLGMVVADGNVFGAHEHWSGNEALLGELLPKMGIAPDIKGRTFPGGSIFWIRSYLLRTLLAAPIRLDDFEPEPLPDDGALPHAIERTFGLICEDAGMRIAELSSLRGPIPGRSLHSRPVHIIAYYLPQFHPIPENDEWWGTGFTEWANVTRAKPLFEGHRQPLLPADLGFYDLRLAEAREAQAKLARRYGLDAFCYYYYWFNGRRVLERPLDDVLASGKPDFPFLICWANEPWTRNWDGESQHVLLPQTYEPGWATRFVRDVAPLLRDRRYFRLGGKPMLLIYRIGHIPDQAAAMNEIRVGLRLQGIPDVHLAAAWVYFIDDGELPADPGVFGLDAYFEFPPHLVPAQPLHPIPPGLPQSFEGRLFDYNRTVTAALEKLKDPVAGQRHRCVMAGFDNTARKPGSSHIYHGATPSSFRRWLRGTILHEQHENGEQVVFVNAWNEWAEGTHLEPDRDFGCGWLEAIASSTEAGKEGR
jgi:lipopolysaccharide biosynthesis protein/glycosyltransferase involved in cell wall biosynthesis/tetratricopeptide (TPR) repeat protein